MKGYDKNCEIIIVGNKIDLRENINFD